jgi:hypothetical protein
VADCRTAAHARAVNQVVGLGSCRKKAAAKKVAPKKRVERNASAEPPKSAAETLIRSLRQEPRDSRHARIDVAIEIIQSRGVDVLTVEDVCERVGVSKVDSGLFTEHVLIWLLTPTRMSAYRAD